MSYNHPNVKEVIENSTGRMSGSHFHKTYLQLAKQAFKKRHKRWPTIDDSQNLRDLFEDEWYDYYVERPKREAQDAQYTKSLLPIVGRYKRELYSAMCEFVRFKYCEFKATPDRGSYWLDKFRGEIGYYPSGSITPHLGGKQLATFIVESGFVDEFRAFVDKHHTHMKAYFKSRYTDYSHLAYNGVTDDF